MVTMDMDIEVEDLFADEDMADKILEYISETYMPDEVFDEDELYDWATDSGFSDLDDLTDEEIAEICIEGGLYTEEQIEEMYNQDEVRELIDKIKSKMDDFVEDAFQGM